MNDLSILREPYIQICPNQDDENQHTVAMPLMWGGNVFCEL